MNQQTLLSQSFHKAFESINQFEVKKGVDAMGIGGFINHCATLAAATGAAEFRSTDTHDTSMPASSTYLHSGSPHAKCRVRAVSRFQGNSAGKISCSFE